MRVLCLALRAAVLALLTAPAFCGRTDDRRRRRPPTPADVHAFVEQMNADYKARYIEPNAAEWVAETYITDDTQMLTARANERWLQWLSTEVEKCARLRARCRNRREGRARAVSSEVADGDAGAEGSGAPDRAHDARIQAHRRVRRRQILQDAGRRGDVPESRRALQGARRRSRLGSRPRGVGRLASGRPRHAQGLSALRRAPQRRRARSRLRQRRHDVARRLRHVAGRIRQGDRSALVAGAAAVRRAAVLHARQARRAKYGDRMPKDGTIPAHITGNMWAQSW